MLVLWEAAQSCTMPLFLTLRYPKQTAVCLKLATCDGENSNIVENITGYMLLEKWFLLLINVIVCLISVLFTCSVISSSVLR